VYYTVMETFLTVVISGMAVAFALSLITSIPQTLISDRIIKLAITWPISVFSTYFLGITDLPVTVITSFAAAFFALTVLTVVEKLLEKPTIVDRRRI